MSALRTADQWGQVRFQTESCQGEAVCDSAGMYPLQPKELAEYNLYYHVYPQEYKQASDYVLELLTGYHILFVPLLGIFVSYLTLNQEKKENSDKTLWAQPYSKLTIFISKIIANFMMSALILLLTVGFVYLLCGLFSGFHSSQRLMSVYTSFLNGGGKDAVSEYTVIEQWQFNLIILCQNLFTLLVSTVICHFLSLYICNKKLLFFITVCLFLGLPLLIGELVQQVRFHQYSYILKGLYLIYTLLPLHIRYTIITVLPNTFIDIANNSFSISSLNTSVVAFKEMNLMMCFVIGAITIIVLIYIAYLTLKRKDLLR